MKEIPLTFGMFALIDDADFESVSKFKWYAHRGGHCKTYYAHRSVRDGGRKINQSMHYFIIGYKNVDHINGNGLDNRRENLRPADASQNMMNRSPNRGRKYKGAFKTAHGKTWESKITLNGKKIYIGCFPTPEAAARAYDAKAKELFGDFARLNFPEAA